MLVLLGMSTLAAALAPPPPKPDETTSTTSTTQPSPQEPTGGELVEATIKAQAKKPEKLHIPRGDQLALTVESKRAGQVQIQGLGLIEDVAPLSPARFDLLADHRGSHEVRLLQPKRKLGVIELGGR